MIIQSAEFVVSNTDAEKCPEPRLPEYAFIGRSNVGKSSLINMLTQHKNLAKTSGTPGKTQLINHFLINKEWYLVDLPGFGYAKVSKKDRKKFNQIIVDYMKNRPNLVNVFMLVDSRHEPLKNDMEFMEFLGKNRIPFSIVMTKVDKLNSASLGKNAMKYKKKMLEKWASLPPFFLSSSTSKLGRDEILNDISQYNEQMKEVILNLPENRKY